MVGYKKMKDALDDFQNSCDWTSCHDDVTYTESVLYDILASICVDTDQMHVTGRSNGGSFIWSKIMDRLAATFASAGKLTLNHACWCFAIYLSISKFSESNSIIA